ncbi:hypothetical protein F3Y22_tig00109960pilonHSYRG00022 [Hibiscus syriacus]|uniref:MADS-box domain-containing protein n=1 Tax=Hibiscus syriacus TaxID=106335 RepID=A0A6A3BS04_HIBSY|nr:hypothetical protein F3Y22_tig00109960pilonHSYRG00022 [Hibiscus syriacus]
MGRVKLKIKKLENTNGRQATYAKRKHGIMKKANELSILCDVEIILLMFSPTNKPSLCIGKRNIEETIEKFAQLTPQERAKRKFESLEALKKTFKKLDHDVNIHEFLGTSFLCIRDGYGQDLSNQARLLQTRLSEIQRRLSCWTDMDKINNVNHLGQMESSLKESLNQIRAHKSLERNILTILFLQFQNEMRVPLRMGIEQQLQSLAWMPNNDSRPMALPEDSNLIPHRRVEDVECSASSSFGSYSGYFSTPKSSELSSSGQDNGILNDLQLGGQCPFSYDLSILNDHKFPTAAEMNFQEAPVDYHVNGVLAGPRTGYDANQGSWASTSGPCAVTMFDEPL